MSSSTFIYKNSQTGGHQTKLTPTDILAQDFFENVIQNNQFDTAPTPDETEKYVGEYLKTVPLPPINTQQYSIRDLNTTNSTDTEMRTYQKEITDVFKKNWPAGEKQNELVIISKAFSNDDPTVLEDLTEVISIYNNAQKGSLVVKVPEKFAKEHLNVVNSLGTYIQTLQMIQGTYTQDQVDGLAGLKSLLTNRNNLTDSMADLRILLINTIR